MTTPKASSPRAQKARSPRVPPTPKAPTTKAPPVQQQETPEAFIIPTDVLVATIQLVGKLPVAQVGNIYARLQQCQPYVPPVVPDGE